MLRNSIVLSMAIGSMLVALRPALAQQDTATIVGEVTDPSGAVAPRAAVTALNVETGISTRTDTNDAGPTRFRACVPGRTR